MTGVGRSACRGRWTTWGPCSDPASPFSSSRGPVSPTDPSSSWRRSRAPRRSWRSCSSSGTPGRRPPRTPGGFCTMGAFVPVFAVPWGEFHVVKSSLSTYAGILYDRWSRKHLIMARWIVYAMCYAAWGIVEGPAWMVGLFLVYGLYSAATEGAERAFVADFVPPGRRGAAFGWFPLAVGVSAP